MQDLQIFINEINILRELVSFVLIWTETADILFDQLKDLLILPLPKKAYPSAMALKKIF